MKKYIQILLVVATFMLTGILFADWQLSITANDANGIGANHTIILGTCPECNDSWKFGEDQSDYPNPPQLEYTNIHFFHLDWFGLVDENDNTCLETDFSTDFRAEHSPYDLISWGIEGSTGNGLPSDVPIMLTWNINDFENLSSEYEVYLYAGDQSGLNMRNISSIQIEQTDLYLYHNPNNNQWEPKTRVLMGACAATGTTTHYFDSDGDGWGSTLTGEFCQGYAPEGWVENNSDLNDEIPCESNLEDCAGLLCGPAILDDCDICNGNNTDKDCAGVCFGSSVIINLCEDTDGDGLGNPGSQSDKCIDENGNINISDGNDLPDFNLYLDVDGSVFYNSSEPIYGFQFNVEGASVINAFGGDEETAGFMIMIEDPSVLAFSPTLTPIPPGSGTLIQMELTGETSGLSNIEVTNNINGDLIDFILFQQDNIDFSINCSDQYPDCSDNYYDCASVCGGSAIVDQCNICDGPGPEPGYTCDGTPELLLFYNDFSSNFAIYSFSNVTIDNVNIDTDDWIGAFNGDVCVGAQKWENCIGRMCEIPAMGDDGTEFTDGYMTAGDIPNFKIFDASKSAYFDAVASENIPWLYQSFNELSSLRATSGVDYCLELHLGANLKSFYALPDDVSIESVMSLLEDNVIGIISEGGSCAPIEGIGWVGGQCTLVPEKGYWIIVQDNTNLCMEDAIMLDLTLQYDLHAGANLISFPSDGLVSVPDGLPDEIEESILGIITEGGSCAPIEGIGWIGGQCSFVGGKGYWLIATDNISFSFDLSTLGRTEAFDLTGLIYPADYVINQSMNQAFYFVDDISFDNKYANDGWILAYHDNTLVGARQWKGDMIDIPVMGDDGNIYSEGYITEGKIPHFKHLDQSSGELTNLYLNHTPAWENNGIFRLGTLGERNMIPSQILLSAYPNPFNPSTTLSFSVPVEGMIEVSIYNIAGQEIEKLANEFVVPSTYEYTWDASIYPSGVYFAHLNLNNTFHTQKLVLMK